jgi:hypothetical protein
LFIWHTCVVLNIFPGNNDGIVIRRKKHLYSKLDSRITGSSPGFSLGWSSLRDLPYTCCLLSTIYIVLDFLVCLRTGGWQEKGTISTR